MRWNALTLSLALATAPSAYAQQPPPADARVARDRAFVVRVDRELLFLDRGGEGLARGQRVSVYRAIEVRHPITHAALRDRYLIGTVTLHSVGERLSVARVAEPLVRPAQAGDEVEFLDAPPRPAPVRPVAPPVAPTSMAPPVATAASDQAASVTCPPTASCLDADDRAVLDVWRETLGLIPSQRVARWMAYLNAHPRSRHAAAARAAIAQLTSEGAGQTPTADSGAPVGVVALSLGIPALSPGDPAVIALQVVNDRVRPSGRLFVRRPGAETYETVTLREDGDRFLRGEVPRRFVTLEGFEYFVELDGTNGRAITTFGSDTEPVRVAVTPRAEDPPQVAGRTRVDLRAEYADVGSRTVQTSNGPLFRQQRFYLVEGDFFQRLGAGALYGYRVGFGVYSGEGVALSAVNSPVASELSTVIYGYHELEFRVASIFHVIARGALGVHGTGIVGGAQVRLRIGDERRTNLVLGGDLFNKVGQRAFFALNLYVHPRWPLMAQGEVFNQSFSGGDPMFRFIAQAGYRITPWFTLSARGSYQLRNIENGGFGGGLATTFEW